tara:strand:- start:558 stop:1304 length:747 start_codon:yes stop_codon:yes gene_type:complete
MNRNNTEYSIYGLNNAISLLSSTKYLINNISIMKGSVSDSNPLIQEYISSRKKHVKFLNKNEFLSKYNYKHTQGIVIQFSAEIFKDFNLLEFKKKNMCYVIIDQINDPQNLGQIIRTCECAGIDGIILPKHGSVHITDTVLQVSQGAFENIDLFMVTNIKNTIEELKSNDFWVIGMENSIDSKEWYKMDYKKKVAIVFGSESKGIRKLVKESCDFLSTISMKGKINSLNVSASISAIVFERQRQLDLK